MSKMSLSKDEEVKKEIIVAAQKVFQRWGLNKTTMEDIAREAGKGKSTLYYYYKSKEDIFEAVTIEEMNNIIERVNKTIIEIKSPKEKLKKYVTVILNEIMKSISVYPLVRGEIKAKKDFLLDKIKKEIDKKEGNIIKSILKKGLEVGEFNFLQEEELDDATSVILGLTRGLEMYLVFEIEDQKKIDIITRLITEGL